MKKILTLLAVATALFSISMTEQQQPIPKPPLEKTGAPGESYCTDCHSGTPLNGGPGGMTVTFSGTNNKYKPGKAYNITITVFDASESARGGFETTILDQNNLPAGTPKVIDTANTILRNDKNNGRTYMSNYQGAPYETWTYKWTAPATNVGNITIYCTTNATNDDFTPMGDHIYSATLVLKPKSGSPSRIGGEEENSAFTIFPNLIHQQFTANFTVDEPAHIQIDLYNMQGQQQEILYSADEDAGQYQQTFTLNKQYAPGIYFVVMRQGNDKEVKKVMIQ